MSLALRPLSTLLITAALTACSEPASDSEPPITQQTAVEAAPAAQVDAAAARNIEISLGSAVKRLCSSVLIGDRSIDHVMAHELSNPALQEVSFSFEGDLVTADGMNQTVSALYREELGCTLVKDRTEEQLRAQFNAQAYPARVAVSDEEWPLGNRVSLPDEIPGVDLAAINTAMDRAFDDIEPDQDIETRAVLDSSRQDYRRAVCPALRCQHAATGLVHDQDSHRGAHRHAGGRRSAAGRRASSGARMAG
jgi:hypothetical protein